MPITGPDPSSVQAEVWRPDGPLPTVLVAAVALIDAENPDWRDLFFDIAG